MLRTLALAVIGLAVFAAPALAEPTTLTVRTISRDAKFIGTGMGGMEIRLVDARTGAELASGLTAGGTGDTNRLVVEPRLRQAPLAGEGDGVFTAVVDIKAPTLVRLEARGPVGYPASAVTVTAELWVLPGQPVTGDGWVIEVPGLVVSPTASRTPDGLTVTSKVMLMCGCPVTPGGLWDADHYEVIAWVAGPDGIGKAHPLSYSGQASTFGATLVEAPDGPLTITLTAVDKRTGNTGVTVIAVPAQAAK